jgi:hypothetical protein
MVEAASVGLNGQARLIGSRGNGSRRPLAQGLPPCQRITSPRRARRRAGYRDLQRAVGYLTPADWGSRSSSPYVASHRLQVCQNVIHHAEHAPQSAIRPRRHVRRENAILTRKQWMLRRERLRAGHVHCRARQAAGLKSDCEGGGVHHRATGRIDQECGWPELIKNLRVYQPARLIRQRNTAANLSLPALMLGPHR